VHLPRVGSREQTRAFNSTSPINLKLQYQNVEPAFRPFPCFVVLLSQYLDGEPLFHAQLKARKTLRVSFESKSPEAKANLWNLMVF
jgi:hypothetical protein